MAGVDPGARALPAPSLAASTYLPPKPSQWHHRPECALFCIQSASSASLGTGPGYRPVAFRSAGKTLEGCVPNILESRAIPTAILKWNVTFESHTMRRWMRRLLLATCMGAWVPTCAMAQKTLTWEQAKRELEASNPTLRAARIGIQESRADEITAYLRPNPDLTLLIDQFSPLSMPDTPYRPLTDTEQFLAGSYLIERRHKRNLRRESARAKHGNRHLGAGRSRKEFAFRLARRLRAGAPAEGCGSRHP